MHTALSWFARVAGLVFTLLFSWSFLSGNPDSIWRKGNLSLLVFLPLCLPAFLGYLFAWKKPYEGGLSIVFSSLLILVYFLFYGEPYLALFHGLPPVLVGLSFIASAHRKMV